MGAAAAVLLPAAWAAETPDPDAADDVAAAKALVDRAIERYESGGSYRLAFTQEFYWALADSTQTTSGTLVVEFPSMLSVRYEDGGRVIVRGDSFWVYVPQTDQFFSARIDSTDVAMDPARMLRLYEPDRHAPFLEQAGRPDGTTVVLRPKGAYAEPVKLCVGIDPETGLVDTIVAYSTAGDRTTYRIVETRFGVPTAADEFVPSRPPGAQLIRGSPRRSS